MLIFIFQVYKFQVYKMSRKKIRIVFQHDSMQCGIACLQMICNYYGRKYSTSFLDKLCTVTTEGVSLLGLSDAAGKLGMHTMCAKINMELLHRVPLPCIIYWNQNHFVVLYKIKRNRFYIADPGKGLVCCKLNEFENSWISTCADGNKKGIVMLLEPTPLFYSYNKKSEDYEKNIRSFRFLFGYLVKYRGYLGQVLLGLVLSGVLQLALPFLTQSVVDVGIHVRNIGFVWLVLLGQLMLTFSRTAIDFIRSRLLLYISMRVNISLVSDFFIKLFRLPMSFFDSKLVGDLLQRMSDHDRVNRFLTDKAIGVAFAMITFVIFMVVLLLYSLPVSFIFLVGTVFYALWMSAFLRRRKVLDYDLFEQQAINNGKTYELITSMQEIKLQDCEQRRRWDWEDTQADMFEVQLKTLRLQQMQKAGSLFINEMKNMAVTVASAAAVIQGQMTLGMMLAVQYIIGQLNMPVEALMEFFYSLQDVKISLERINEIHRAANEDGPEDNLTLCTDVTSGISIDSMSFLYDNHASVKALDNITLNIPYGRVTAIVGASGSGKTTLVKLMLGYYPVTDGKILIGGCDINRINKKWWRRQCGVVMQNGVIFSESIARNIAVDDGDIDMQRLLFAARMACVHDYVKTLPLGYNTKIGRDGVGLSQGQKQRILIARAVYKNPKFIFFDEATNSLDANNEKRIVENLDRFYQGRTVVIVAHRLSTVRNADQIVVVDGGHIVEIGNHNTLTAKRGAYYNLVKNQLELGN